MQKYAGIAILFLIAGFLACTEEPEVRPLTYTQIFSGKTFKTWVIEQVLVKKAGAPDQEITFSLCEKDDRYTFYADGEKSYVITNGGIKCDPGEPDEYVRDTWSFVNAGAVLNIALPRLFGNFIVPFIVKKAEKTRMVLEIYANQESTISYQVHLKSVEEK